LFICFETPSLRVPHRPGQPTLLDEKVQRRFGCAPNLFFLAKRSNPAEKAVRLPDRHDGRGRKRDDGGT
jgi:hypothetical protein